MKQIRVRHYEHGNGEYSLSLVMGLGQHTVLSTGRYTTEFSIFGFSAQEIIDLGVAIAQLGGTLGKEENSKASTKKQRNENLL